MLTVKNGNVEKFFDIIDETAVLITEHTKKTYLDSLLITCSIIDNNEISDDLEGIEERLKTIYDRLENVSFNREEIRKAFQLALLKAFKHENLSFNDITPDTIGILMAYLVDKLCKDSLTILEPAVGTGNLLFSLMNNSGREIKEVYGVEITPKYIDIAYTLSNLLDYDINFINQNNLTPLIIPEADLIISDLPVTIDNNNYDLTTQKSNITYTPFLMIESLLKYCKEGGYFFYLIPNDFFLHEGNKTINELLLEETHIIAMIELPISMFKSIEQSRSILILRKKGKNILPVKEILMLSFPSFGDTNKVNIAIDKINRWVNNNF